MANPWQEAAELPIDDHPDDAGNYPAERTVRHVHQRQEPLLRVSLERGMKGTYGWSITCEGTEWVKVLEQVRNLDADLCHYYQEEP